jgi:hypothetical protein
MARPTAQAARTDTLESRVLFAAGDLDTTFGGVTPPQMH